VAKPPTNPTIPPPISTKGAAMEPWIGWIRVTDGRRQTGGHPGSAWLTPPLHSAPGRESERFAMVLDLSGPAPSRLYREIRDAAAQAFWSTPGSPIAALRRAVMAAHRTLSASTVRSPRRAVAWGISPVPRCGMTRFSWSTSVRPGPVPFPQMATSSTRTASPLPWEAGLMPTWRSRTSPSGLA